MGNKSWWIIAIGGYGEFDFEGTEDEAEDMRRNKACWEGGIGTKRKTSVMHPMVKHELAKRPSTKEK